MDDVQCSGSENNLQDCPHSPNHNCGGGEGAGVVCTDPGEMDCTIDRQPYLHIDIMQQLMHLVFKWS